MRPRTPYGLCTFSRSRNTAQHPGKHQLVQRVNAVPVDQAGEAERVEDGGLTNGGLVRIALNDKLQLGPAGQLHLGL